MIESLTKVSIRAMRSACPKCGNAGPFYAATDQNGTEHRVIANKATLSIAQGESLPLSYLHVCTEQNGTHNGTEVPAPAPAPTQDNGADAEIVPAPAQGNGAGSADEMAALRDLLLKVLGTPQIDAEQVKDIAREVIEGVVMPERTIVVADNEQREIDGVTHKDFDKLLKAIAARRNVQLVGPPGTGKTHVCAQVAEALGIDFYSIGYHLQSTASELKGYMSATGEFVWTVVYDWATNPNGGVLLNDELDRSHAGIQAALNSLLSNRWITFPNRETVKLTDKHVMVAATNTWGDGPTWEFPAAQKFSAEFKDRFVAIWWDIDENIELQAALAEGAPVDVTKRAVAYVQRVRANVKREAIAGVVVSPRASQNMAALLAQNVDWDDAVAWTLRKGMDDAAWGKVSA
ncbi:AAA-ATPase [Mycobacterium phage DuncansLeg]|nr:AAA-ATPase [Mycobacterium phage DuncansLeg]